MEQREACADVLREETEQATRGAAVSRMGGTQWDRKHSVKSEGLERAVPLHPERSEISLRCPKQDFRMSNFRCLKFFIRLIRNKNVNGQRETIFSFHWISLQEEKIGKIGYKNNELMVGLGSRGRSDL